MALDIIGQQGFSDLTPGQRREALLLAQKVRARRAELCEQLRAGMLPAGAILDPAAWKLLDPGDYKALKGLKVISFLRCLPGIGDKKAAQAMEACGVRARRRMNGLGPGQRAKLMAWLAARNTV